MKSKLCIEIEFGTEESLFSNNFLKKWSNISNLILNRLHALICCRISLCEIIIPSKWVSPSNLKPHWFWYSRKAIKKLEMLKLSKFACFSNNSTIKNGINLSVFKLRVSCTYHQMAFHESIERIQIEWENDEWHF